MNNCGVWELETIREDLLDWAKFAEKDIEQLSEEEFVFFDYLIGRGPYHAVGEEVEGVSENPHELPLDYWFAEAASLHGLAKRKEKAWRKLVLCEECQRLLKRGGDLLSLLARLSELPERELGFRALSENYIEVLMLLYAVEPLGGGWFHNPLSKSVSGSSDSSLNPNQGAPS